MERASGHFPGTIQGFRVQECMKSKAVGRQGLGCQLIKNNVGIILKEQFLWTLAILKKLKVEQFGMQVKAPGA